MKKFSLLFVISLLFTTSMIGQVKQEQPFKKLFVNRNFTLSHTVYELSKDGSIWFFFQNSKYEHITDIKSIKIAANIDEAIQVYEETLNSLSMDAGWYTLSNGIEIQRKINQVVIYSSHRISTAGYTYINRAQAKRGIKKLTELK